MRNETVLIAAYGTLRSGERNERFCRNAAHFKSLFKTPVGRTPSVYESASTRPFTSSSPVSALMFSMYSPSPLMCNLPSAVCTVMSVSLKKSTRVTPLAVRRERFSMCKECAFALAVCATVSPILFYAVSPIYMQRFSEKDRTSSEYLCKRAAQHVKSTVKKLTFLR